MIDEDLIKQVRAEREERAKRLGGRKKLILRLSTLSPEAVLETIIGRWLDAERFLKDAEEHQLRLTYERLDRQAQKLMAKPNRNARECERLYELWDEMDELGYPCPVDPERAPLSEKYTKMRALKARIAERKEMNYA
jgi:hypothetical protein